MSDRTAQDRAHLATLLQEWQKVLQTIVARHKLRRRIRPERYTQLHQSIIEHCEQQLNCREVPDSSRELHRRLLNLLTPWISLEVLDRTDSGILVDLIAKCRALEARLTGRKLRRPIPTWVWWIVAATGIACAILWLTPPETFDQDWIAMVRGNLYRLRVRLQRTTLPQRIGLGSVIVAILGYLALRGARKY